MRGTFASSLTRRTWWWVFALFIAAPAVALTWLGVRSIRATEIERDQRIRDEQAGVATLVDAALSDVLDRTIGDAAGHPGGAVTFVVENSGVIAFPADRVYFGPFGATPSSLTRLDTSPATTTLIGQAQTAEAQSRHDEARGFYERVRADADLALWASLKLAMVAVDSGDRSRLSAIADSRLATSDSRTPAGIPLAVAASSYGSTLSARDRAAFLPLVAATLEELRAGRWWLHADQRRAYDAELRSVLRDSGRPGTLPEADSRFEQLSRLDVLLRKPATERAATQRAALVKTDSGSVLLVWEATTADRLSRPGVALFGAPIAALFDSTLGPLVANHDFHTALRDDHGTSIWGDVDDAQVSQAVALESVDGWELAFTGPTVPVSGRLVNYGLVLLPIVMLASGLVMTAWIVRRDLALARLQSTFVAAVTHEFKSPITSIRLLMERLSGGRVDAGDARQRYYAAVGAETDRLEGLVNRLLESQKLQSGQKHYTFRLASLSTIAEDIVGRLRSHAEARGIHLALTIDPVVPEMAIDRESIADAISNLIDNAIKYSSAGTTVSVALRMAGEEVLVDVADEGIGVDPEDARRIFEPFYRSLRGDHANVHGTGLGLSLVKAAAEAHGGSVEVSSDGRRGSRFTLRLPRLRVDDASATSGLASAQIQPVPPAR